MSKKDFDVIEEMIQNFKIGAFNDDHIKIGKAYAELLKIRELFIRDYDRKVELDKLNKRMKDLKDKIISRQKSLIKMIQDEQNKKD